MESEEEAFAYLESIPEMEMEQMEIVKEDTGMDITKLLSIPQGQKKKKSKKIKFSLRGLISNQNKHHHISHIF